MVGINWWNIELGEEEQEAIARAMATRHIAQGEITEEFEEKVARYLKVPYAVAVPNGTQALSLAYMASGLGVGDEIITSNRTFVATAHAALLLGAKIRVVDVKDNQTLDEKLLENIITKQTKLIVPVHMNGIASNMDSIMKIAKMHNLQIVEDACQAFGSKDKSGKFLGTFGRFGCFSLGLAKLLTTGQGGVVVAHTREDCELLKRIRNQGVFDVRKERDYCLKAYNFKFNDMQAAIGIEQLKKMEVKIANSIALYEAYRKELCERVEFLESDIANGEIPMRCIIMVKNNSALKEYLQAKGIGTSYESPSLNHCAHLGICGEYPKSERFHNEMLILPSGPNQDLKNVAIVCNIITQWWQNKGE